MNLEWLKPNELTVRRLPRYFFYGKVTKGKAPAPGKKEAKKGEEQVEEKKIVTTFPKSEEHFMSEVTQFLTRLESDTIKHEYASH